MRQGQQNRRGRGRSNNNNNNNNNHGRKPQNPLTRNYESSGPDVKIRGTAAQVAEKYMALARDAASSGDSVMAENYLQHAEHYNRIIMAAQAQAAPQQHPHQHGAEHVNGGMNGQHRPHNDGHFAMRDQPQPIIEPQQQQQATPVPPGMEPQPEIVEPQPAQASEPAESEPAQPATDGRRRRRRYPAGGNSRSGGGENGGGHNGSGNGLDTAADSRPPDEVVAN
jgi:hypothetical protein